MTSKLRSLWDSDEGEQQGYNKADQRRRVQPSLFDNSDSEKEPCGETLEQQVDYKTLYLCELEKRKAAEERVEVLCRELTSLKSLVSELQGRRRIETEDVPCLGDEEEEIARKARLPGAAVSTEWEVLAKEEKERRQQKIRALQAKQRIQVATKRVVAKTLVIGSDEGLLPAVGLSQRSTTATVPTTAAEYSGRNSANHYLDSSDSSCAEEGVGNDSPSPSPSPPPEAAPTPAAPTPAAPTPAALTPATAAAQEEEGVDPEEAKWRELAAQERQRKALARRSVRTVRRVGAGAAEPGDSAGWLEGGSGTDATGRAARVRSTVRQRHLRGPQLHSALATVMTARCDAPSPAPFATVVDGAPASGWRAQDSADSGSGWDSDSDSGVESSADGDRSDAGNRPIPSASADQVQPPCAAAAPEGPQLTAEEEAAMDARLRRWAATRSLPALLCSVPDVLQHSAGAVKMEDLQAALAPLRQVGASGPGGSDRWAATRMAYMRVVRCCHPDKHMDLLPRSAAFLELQKVFTALCEAYKAHKGAADNC